MTVKPRLSEIEKGNRNSVCPPEIIILKVPFFGYRHVQALLIFFLTFQSYSVKSYLSPAIVAMTTEGSSPNPDIPVYDWNNTSVILSSILWGYIVFQVYAGQVSKTHGPKWFLFGSIFVPSTVSVLMPLAAQHFGSTGMIVCRVIEGLALGFIFPAIHGIMGVWVPKEERTTLGSFMYGGCSVGTIFGTLAAGYLSTSWLGWPAVFYLVGGMGFIWCILWAIFGFDSPETHPSISEAEKKYIMASLSHVEGAEVVKTPWKHILTCVPFLSIVVATLASCWVANTFIMETPTYMVHVLGLSVDTASMLSILHSVLGPIFGFLSGILSDRIIASKRFRVITVRRCIHAAATLIPAVLYAVIGYLPTDQSTLSVVVITTALVLASLSVNSTTVNYIDLSPKFAGVMLGISNGLGQTLSIVAPLLVQFTVKDETDITQWRILFLTTAGLVLVGSITFISLSSDQRQWWDAGVEGKKKNKETG